jgi:hypothetical protein
VWCWRNTMAGTLEALTRTKPRRKRGPSVRALRGVRTLRNDFGVFRSGTIPSAGIGSRKKSPAEAGPSEGSMMGATGTLNPGPTRSRSRASTPELGRRHLPRVPFSQHCLKIDNKRLFEEASQFHDRWLRTRIRCSRVALPPKAPSGETTAASGFWGITLSGMTLAEQRVVPSPGPPPP